GRRPGKTRPRAGRNGGVPKVASFAWTDVPQPNGPGLPPDAPTTLAPGLPPLPHTAAKTSRDTRGKATSWCIASVTLQLVAPSWVSLFQRFCNSSVRLNKRPILKQHFVGHLPAGARRQENRDWKRAPSRAYS